MRRLGKQIQETVKLMGYAKGIEEASIVNAWPKIVGDKIAAQTKPIKTKKGILFVAVKSSAWAQELSLMKPAIMRQAEKTGQSKLKDIKFFAAELNEETGKGPEKDNSQLSEQSLSKRDRAVINEITSRFGGDARLEIMRDLVTKDLLLKKSRLKRGWKPCSACGALVKPDPESCPFCG